MFSSREEYLAAIQRDIDRLNKPISGFSGDTSGVTVTTTINGTTTTNHVAGKKFGNISTEIGCVDFGKKDNKSSAVKGFFGVVHIDGVDANNEKFTIDRATDVHGNTETKTTGNVAVTTATQAESNRPKP